MKNRCNDNDNINDVIYVRNKERLLLISKMFNKLNYTM